MPFYLVFLILVNFLFAGGITADAGLTPPLDRIIFRTQVRTMNMSGMGMNHTVNAYPFVAAYGIKPSVAIIGRILLKKTSNANIHSNSKNFLLLVKPRLYRINTSSYTIGVSGVIGSLYEKESGTSLVTGLQGSFRRERFAMDHNIDLGYAINSSELNSNFNSAFSWLIPIKNSRNLSFSPVLESSFSTENSNRFTLSPGAKITISSFIIEALYSFPLYQSSSSMKFENGWLFGLRLMM